MVPGTETSGAWRDRPGAPSAVPSPAPTTNTPRRSDQASSSRGGSASDSPSSWRGYRRRSSWWCSRGLPRASPRARADRSATARTRSASRAGRIAVQNPSAHRQIRAFAPSRGRRTTCAPSSHISWRTCVADQWSDRRARRRSRCRIEPYLDQGGACGAAGPASAPGSAFPEARPAHAGPQLACHADHHGAYGTQTGTAHSHLPRYRLSSSRSPRQWRPLRAVARDRLRRPLTR